MDSRNKVRSEASKFFFVTRFFFVTEFFVVTKFFFVTGTIVPIPIPCADLPLEAGFDFYLLGGTEGGCPNADAEWGLVLRETTGGEVRMRSVKSTLEDY